MYVINLMGDQSFLQFGTKFPIEHVLKRHYSAKFVSEEKRSRSITPINY